MFAEARAYERFMGRWSRRLAPPFVEFAGVVDGDVVLDVGSGTGSVAVAVLDAGTRTRVIGIDPSSTYVAYARRAAAADGRAEFEEGDAQRLRFADHSFDKTLALLVLNFIPDRDRALAEMIRVTRPGGVVAAAVWDYGGGMEMLRIFWDEAVALDPGIESKDERHMPLCRPGELAGPWRAHGLGGVREQELVVATYFASFEDFWTPFLGGQGPAGAYVAALPPERRAALEQRLRLRLLGGRNDGPIRLTARAWVVSGTTGGS